jgi:trk system potassium uptake protein TrkA
MKIVIVGCGRVGSTLAENLDEEGHDVLIFDIRTTAFDRLPETFKGAAVRGDGTDEEVLRRNGVADADVFLALTEGDNRNVMAAQVAMETFAIPQVVAKINDPVRAAAYAELGVVTICRTNMMVDLLGRHLRLPMHAGPGIDVPQVTHQHPHRPTEASAPASEASPQTAPRPATPRPGVPPSANARPVRDSAREEAKGQRPGFRRWRG